MPIDETTHIDTTVEDHSSTSSDNDVIPFPVLQHGCFAPWMHDYVIHGRVSPTPANPRRFPLWRALTHPVSTMSSPTRLLR